MDILMLLLEAANKKQSKPKHKTLSAEQKDRLAQTAGGISALGSVPLQHALHRKLKSQWKNKKSLTYPQAEEKSRLWAKRMDVSYQKVNKGTKQKIRVLNPPGVTNKADIIGSPYYDLADHEIGMWQTKHADRPVGYKPGVFAHEMGHAAHISKLKAPGRLATTLRSISPRVLPLAAGVMAADAADTADKKERRKKIKRTAGLAAVAGYLPIHDEIRADINVYKALKKTMGAKKAARSVVKHLGPALATYGVAYPGLIAGSTALAYKLAKNEHYAQNKHLKGYKTQRESGKSKVY